MWPTLATPGFQGGIETKGLYASLRNATYDVMSTWGYRLTLSVVASAFALPAQTNPARREFEVASVKIDPDVAVRMANGGTFFSGTRITWSGGTLTLQHFSVRDLIREAYALNDQQIAGSGAVLDSPRYRIVAKAPPNTSENGARLMTQSLLADRFALRFHREMRELPAYALVTAKSGPKLTKAKDRADKKDAVVLSLARGHISQPLTMADLAALLTKRLGRQVSDMTGIKGEFEIDLQWTPSEDEPNSPGGPPEKPHTTVLQAADTGLPSIFTAIQEQLGLRLQAHKNIAVDVLVVDSVGKPGPD